MPAHVYEVLALAARFWFLFLMVIIVWQTYRWYARDRRLRKKRLETLPDAGYIGEFVLMRPVAGLAAGTAFRVPAEGTLGLLRGNDICLPAAGVADRHLLFRYSREEGICLTPLGGNEFTVDQTPIGDQPGGLYVVHGSRLYVGEAELRLRMFEGYEVLRPGTNAAPAGPGSPWGQTAGMPQGAWVQAMPPYAPPMPAEPEGYSPPMPQRQDPWRQNPYAREPQPSPYGKRVRPQLSETRRRRSAYGSVAQSVEPESLAAAETLNPYRSRRSIPGLRRDHTGRYRSVAGERSTVFAPLPDEASALQAALQPEPAPEKAEKGSAFSSMSDYARLMARAAEQQPAQTAEAPKPAADLAPAKAAAEPQPKQAQQPAQTAALKTAAQAAAGTTPRTTAIPAPKAPAAPETPAAPTFAPADPQAPDVDMVFEELRPEDSAISDEVVFHPLMDDEDWSDWDEDWSAPAAKPRPVSRAARLAAAKTADSGAYAPVRQTAKPEAAPAKPVKAELPEPLRRPEEEAWPYLSRTGQWQAEELFADLLDEDGTDATTASRSSWTEEGSEGSTTRRMLQRYFRGGGM